VKDTKKYGLGYLTHIERPLASLICSC